MAGSPTTQAAADAPAVTTDTDRSYVDWPAIVAGAVFATAIALLFMSFGSAIGLSLSSLVDGERSAVAAVIAVGLWILWVAVSSFMAGGYLTGRLRRRLPETTPHEAEMRDGMHGLVTWAVSTLIAAVLAAISISGFVGLSAQAVSGAASVAEEVAGDEVDETGYRIDRLFRIDGESAGVPSVVRDRVGRVLTQSVASGEVSADDRTYLAGVIAARTELSEDDANARVEQLSADIAAAAEAAENAADMARRIGILSAFLIAAGLVIGAAGAWWTATVGGHHRDAGTRFERLFPPLRPR